MLLLLLLLQCLDLDWIHYSLLLRKWIDFVGIWCSSICDCHLDGALSRLDLILVVSRLDRSLLRLKYFSLGLHSLVGCSRKYSNAAWSIWICMRPSQVGASTTYFGHVSLQSKFLNWFIKQWVSFKLSMGLLLRQLITQFLLLLLLMVTVKFVSWSFWHFCIHQIR